MHVFFELSAGAKLHLEVTDLAPPPCATQIANTQQTAETDTKGTAADAVDYHQVKATAVYASNA